MAEQFFPDFYRILNFNIPVGLLTGQQFSSILLVEWSLLVSQHNLLNHDNQDNLTFVLLNRFTLFALLFHLMIALCWISPVQASVLVASASSIREPLDKVVQLFKAQHQVDIKVSYGASGNLTHQILRGAPYEVFLSANAEFPSRIESAGYHFEPPRDYATGQLVLYANSLSACNVENGISGLPDQIRQNSIKRLAIANPQLAPYGIAARQALENANVWKDVKPVLAFGNSVAQAAQFALSGAADCAVISLSLALHAGLTSQGSYQVINSSSHSPIRHQMILLKTAGMEAQAFYQFLQTPEAAAVFLSYGFKRPSKGKQ